LKNRRGQVVSPDGQPPEANLLQADAPVSEIEQRAGLKRFEAYLADFIAKTDWIETP
jgi:hypothetical protein